MPKLTAATAALILATTMVTASSGSASADPEGYSFPVVTTQHRTTCQSGFEIRSVMTYYTVTLPLNESSLHVEKPVVGIWQTSRPLRPLETHRLHCALPGALARSANRLRAAQHEIRRLRAALAHRTTKAAPSPHRG